MKIVAALFLTILAVCGTCADTNTDLAVAAMDLLAERYSDADVGTVSIKAKAHLPPERLAEAIAAKALLTYSKSLMLEASRIRPHEPLYPYLLAVLKAAHIAREDGLESDYSASRPFLEHCLRIDPNYLPARYAYALMKPTHEQRMAALAVLAEVDADNAKPYYLMAIETCDKISEGRAVDQASGGNAVVMSPDEWRRISDLIQKGNDRPQLAWRQERKPSGLDVTISTRGKGWPREAVCSRLALLLEVLAVLGDAFDPGGVPHARERQFARQANWMAELAMKRGDAGSALGFVRVTRSFGRRYAAARPYQADRFITGSRIRTIAAVGEMRVLKRIGDKGAISNLEAENTAWSDALVRCSELAKQLRVTVPGIRVSAKKPLVYTDFAAEESGMEKILAGLGLIP